MWYDKYVSMKNLKEAFLPMGMSVSIYENDNQVALTFLEPVSGGAFDVDSLVRWEKKKKDDCLKYINTVLIDLNIKTVSVNGDKYRFYTGENIFNLKDRDDNVIYKYRVQVTFKGATAETDVFNFIEAVKETESGSANKVFIE